MWDITNFSDNELSMIVFNDETLYLQRRNLKRLKERLDAEFIYSESQWNVLVQDIEEDLV